MRRGRTRAWHAAVGAVVVIALACCGGPGGGAGSTATFIVNGLSTTVTVSGTVKESIGENPALRYSGPEGCKGRYFTADIDDALPLTFHYSSQDAYLFYARTVYHFVTAPQLEHGELVWDHTFNGNRIVAKVACSPPPPSGPLLPPNY